MSYQFNPLENLLGLKAIAWNFNSMDFVSPSWSGFHWSQDGLETMKECKSCGLIPKDDCTCGLYTTFEWNTVMEYRYHSPISPVLLWEVSGRTILYQYGMRSQQLTPRWVILDSFEPVLYAACYQAADYFHIPIVQKSIALSIMDVWNILLFMKEEKTKDWREWYMPETHVLRLYSDDNIKLYGERLGFTYEESQTEAHQSV